MDIAISGFVLLGIIVICGTIVACTYIIERAKTRGEYYKTRAVSEYMSEGGHLGKIRDDLFSMVKKVEDYMLQLDKDIKEGDKIVNMQRKK